MNGLDLSKLVDIVATGIRVLVKRGTCQLTEDAIYDRARNIVQAVIVNFEMRALPALPEGVPERRPEPEPLTLRHPLEWPAFPSRFPKVTELRELYAQGKPEGHGHSCACRDCKVFNQARRAQ